MNVNLTPNITGKNVNIIKGATQADLTNSVNNSKTYRDESEAFSIVSENKSIIATYSANSASYSATTASNAATIATTKANEANNSANSASESETVCIAKATIATDNADIAIAQAVIATDKATEANTSANTANTQANIAIAKASEASISASNALTSENNADTSEANALIYRNQAESFANSINPSDLVHISGTETITGNKTFSGTVSGLTKATVGLNNVDNTSDSSKSVNYATTAGTASASDVYSWAKEVSKPSYTASEIGLGNVTNESKTTMFTSPTFTGTVTLPSTTSIGTISSAELQYLDGVTSNVQGQIDTINTHISGVTAYHLLQGNLSVDATVLTNGFGIYLYTGNTTTLPTINLGMDITSQWGNTANETYGYLIKIKSRSATGDWTWVNSVRGITKYISSNTTSAEGTDANMFTLSTVAGVTTLNIGTSTRTNTNGVTYVVEVYQTTHKKTGVTNQGKAFTEHYNPDTGFTINGYVGSGLAGHEIPHSLGRKLGIIETKDLSAVVDWWVNTDSGYMALNTTDLNNILSNESTDSNVILNSTTGFRNTATNQYIMFGWRNSYFDESGKLIGNFEIGVYQGTANATGYNKVLTKAKLALFMPKRLDTTGSWYSSDNQRNNGDSLLVLNTNQVEIVGTDHFDYVSDGIICKSAATELNASGGQYLYFGIYDNDSGSGKSKYYKATDTANVQINNGIIPLAHGIDSNGSKNSIVVANETITGVTYTEGRNYLYKTDTGYGVKAYEPRYLASELVRKFAGEQPDYYDVESNKWFNCDAGAELITNGKFSSGVTTGWTADGSNILSVSNGTMLVNRNNSTSYGAKQTILTEIGKKYTIRFKVTSLANSGTPLLYIGSTVNGEELGTFNNSTTGTFEYSFVAQTTNTYLSFGVTTSGTGIVGYDDITCFAKDIIPTTEITESRNYMNHIVHADADGGVLYVEELPKIEYKNVIKAEEYLGKNACTAWATINGQPTPPTILGSYGISSVIKTSTGKYELIPTEDFDNEYFSVTGISGISTAELKQLESQTKNRIKVQLFTGSAFVDANFTVQVFGGRN